MKTTTQKQLACPCGATAKDTSKERGRFIRRHPPASFYRTPEENAQAMADHIEDQKRMKAVSEAKAAAIIQKAKEAAKQGGII